MFFKQPSYIVYWHIHHMFGNGWRVKLYNCETCLSSIAFTISKVHKFIYSTLIQLPSWQWGNVYGSKMNKNNLHYLIIIIMSVDIIAKQAKQLWHRQPSCHGNKNVYFCTKQFNAWVLFKMQKAQPGFNFVHLPFTIANNQCRIHTFTKLMPTSFNKSLPNGKWSMAILICNHIWSSIAKLNNGHVKFISGFMIQQSLLPWQLTTTSEDWGRLKLGPQLDASQTLLLEPDFTNDSKVSLQEQAT